MIPPPLASEATKLIVHYDVWLEAYDRIRRQKSPSFEQSFVFAGPEGYPFPTAAEAAFKQEFDVGPVRGQSVIRLSPPLRSG
jgi:hypothetical protein